MVSGIACCTRINIGVFDEVVVGGELVSSFVGSIVSVLAELVVDLVGAVVVVNSGI